MKNASVVATILLAFVLLGAECNKDDNPVGSAGSGTYVGTFVSTDTTSGIIVVTVSGSGSVSGTVKLYDDTLTTVTISGTVSGASLTATASDGTPIAGVVNDSTISGTANNGEAVFTLRSVSTTVQLLTYAGTYSSTTGPPETGVLIVCTAATTMWGVVVQEDGQVGDYLIGTISGTSVSVESAFDPGTEVASGTQSGSTWSGTYTGDSNTGTWTVTLVP